MTKQKARRGFTLVELLIVVALIAVISGMVIGLFGSATGKSAATVSMATQKQLLNQMNSYQQLHNAMLPDNFDSMIRADYATAGGTYTTLGTYSIAVEGTMDLNVPDDLTAFIAQPVTAAADTADKNINRGVHPDAYSGRDRVLTVKQITSDDVTLLSSLGITTLYDTRAADYSYGEPRYTARTLAVDDPICIVDPQTVAGQRLYQDFGVDLSDAGLYPRKGADDAGTAWDDTDELTDAGRLAALTTQMFYVLAIGPNSTMVGDTMAGIQEAPTSSIVSQGYYNRFSLVIKKGAMNRGDRTAGIAGVLDPKGNGATAARRAVDSVQ